MIGVDPRLLQPYLEGEFEGEGVPQAVARLEGFNNSGCPGSSRELQRAHRTPQGLSSEPTGPTGAVL